MHYQPTFISAKEMTLLVDEPGEYFKLYAYIRSKMNIETKISGLDSKFSTQAFRELLSIPETQGRHKNRAKESTKIDTTVVNRRLNYLERIGLIKRRKDLGYFVFEHLMPLMPQSVQNMTTGRRQDDDRMTTSMTTRKKANNSMNKKGNENMNTDMTELSCCDDAPMTTQPHRYKDIKIKDNNTLSDERVSSKDKTKEVPYQKIVDLYHETLPELPKVLKITEDRKRHLNARWKEHPDLDFWRDYFSKVKEKDFLMGKVKNWKADFDFLINEKKFIKILEGGYIDYSNNQNNTGEKTYDNRGNEIKQQQQPRTKQEKNAAIGKQMLDDAMRWLQPD